MFSKSNNTERIDAEQREQYNYARSRVLQKKRLMQHFIIFLVGSIFIIVLNQIFKVGEDFFIKNWFAWAIGLWAFLYVIHVFNVFIMNKFMGKEWEDKQLEKLKAKQAKKIEELQNKVDKEVPLPKATEVKKK